MLRLPEVELCYEQCWGSPYFVGRERGAEALSVMGSLIMCSHR